MIWRFSRVSAFTKNNIFFVEDWFNNEISSTKVRRAVSRDESVKYVVDDQVIEYINQNQLYRKT